MVLKEITAFTDTLNELGAHRVIDDQAHAGSTKSEFKFDQLSNQYREVLQFMQGKTAEPHHQFLKKGMAYATEEFSKLFEALNSANLGFNSVSRGKFKVATEGQNYTPEQLLGFVTGWNEYIAATGEYLKVLLDPTKPMANWETYHVDSDKYFEFENNLDALLLDKLDITVTKFNGNLVSQLNYGSDLRNAVALEDHVAYAGENYASLDSAKQLKSGLDKLTSEATTLYTRLSNLSEMLANYPEQHDVHDQLSLKLSYRLLSGLLQGTIYMTGDLKTIKDMYN